MTSPTAISELLSQLCSVLNTVTKSALCQAGQKFKASAFCELNALWVSRWHQAQTSYRRWCGLRVVAADGVCFQVPKWRENRQTFGWGPTRTARCS